VKKEIMKFSILIGLLIIFNLRAEISLDEIRYTHSLVLIQEHTRAQSEDRGHLHLKLCPLSTLTAVTDHQIAFNKLPEASKKLDIEQISMLKDGVEAVLEPCSFDEVPIRSKKSACGFKVKDASGTTYIFVFKGSHGEKYQAWILPNSTIDIFIGQMSDEVVQIGDSIENETIELPYIPLPACMTRVLVKVGTAVLIAYFTIKEGLQEFYSRVHKQFLKEHENDQDEEDKREA
jgi:hypothetical protein